MKTINTTPQIKVALPQQNKPKNIEYIYNDEAIKEEKHSKKTVSLKSNSGRFVFTLNGDNEKSEKKSKSKEKIESEEKSEKSVSTKKEISQEQMKETQKTKKKKDEENEIISTSSHKKEHIIHNSNLQRESSLNSISSVDNIESTKLIIGKNFDSINKLLADIGSRRWRRKSNITNGHFRKNLLNDMVSFSSSFSNFFNNVVETRRNSNFNFKYPRCNSSLNLKNENDFNIQMSLNNKKNISNEKNEENNKNKEDSLEVINKLKNLKVSLENEKSISHILKNINESKNNNKNKKNNKHSRNEKENKKGSVRSRELNTVSTKSTGSNLFYYPNVYYINPDIDSHNKIHISTFFSNFKKEKKFDYE